MYLCVCVNCVWLLHLSEELEIAEQVARVEHDGILCVIVDRDNSAEG